VTALVNSSGVLLASYKYNPYGGLISSSGALASANTMRFSSKPAILSATGAWGFYYYGYRFYDPLNQRWLNRDPLEEGGGRNLYTVVLNCPVGLVDAYGLHWTDSIPEFFIAPSTVNFAAGMGDTVSFGITSWLRQEFAINDVVDRCADGYKYGEWAGIAHGVLMGGKGLLKGGAQSMRTLFWNNVSAVKARRDIWRAVPGGADGRALHHWLIPDRWEFIPQGIRNSGLNLIPIYGPFNTWLGFALKQGVLRSSVARLIEHGILAPTIAGSLAAPLTAALRSDPCAAD
jgi:RHS repeat-associated protein